MSCIKNFLRILSVQIFIIFITVSVYSQNLLNGPNDLVFDSSNNRYLVANWAGNSIVAIDSLGNQSYFRTNITHAHGMEIKDSILFVASYHNLLLIDLNSSFTINSIFVSGAEYLSHIALDSSHYAYITDWSAQKLFRIDVSNMTSIPLYTFSVIPGGVSYDENNNCLIILTFVNNAPILGYNISNGELFTILNTNINNLVAICKDVYGNYYITSFGDNTVYEFGDNFSTGPEIISTGHNSPSGLGYNRRDNIIGVTNYDSNSIDFIQLEPNDVKYEQEIKPADYLLFQNYPNPFNPVTKIRFTIPSNVHRQMSNVSLKVFDVLGNEIATLVNEEKPAGEYEIEFNGEGISSGIYFYRLQTNKYVGSKKMIYIK